MPHVGFHAAPDAHGQLLPDDVPPLDGDDLWDPGYRADPKRYSRAALIGRNYDVSPDGKKFLVVTAPRDAVEPPDLVVVQHWDEELKARTPRLERTAIQ